MTTLASYAACQTASKGPGIGPLAMLRAWHSASSRERTHRRAAKALRELDDHMLNDIGLTRGGIDAAVRGG